MFPLPLFWQHLSEHSHRNNAYAISNLSNVPRTPSVATIGNKTHRFYLSRLSWVSKYVLTCIKS